MKHGWIATHNNECLIRNVYKTSNFFERACGLLFRQKLGNDEALLIVPCASVHTAGMRYSIDIVFLDYSMKVIKTAVNIHPWRISLCRGASAVLELPAHSIEQLELETGQHLVWHNTNYHR